MVSQDFDLIRREDDQDAWNRMLDHLRTSVAGIGDLIEQVEVDDEVDVIELGVRLSRIHEQLEQVLKDARNVIGRKP